MEGWINENYLFLAYPLALWPRFCVSPAVRRRKKEIKGSAEQIVNYFLILYPAPYHFDIMQNPIITIIKTFWPVNSSGGGIGIIGGTQNIEN